MSIATPTSTGRESVKNNHLDRGPDRQTRSEHAHHYLHHKYFEVNYGDGLIPFDKWFGTWHDGSSEGDARMNARYEKRKERVNAVKAAS